MDTKKLKVGGRGAHCSKAKYHSFRLYNYPLFAAVPTDIDTVPTNRFSGCCVKCNNWMIVRLVLSFKKLKGRFNL